MLLRSQALIRIATSAGRTTSVALRLQNTRFLSSALPEHGKLKTCHIPCYKSRTCLPPASKTEQAHEFLRRKGYHMGSIWEQPVAWGESDSFRHLNNVHYARYAESGRIKFMEQMAIETKGPEAVKDLVTGRGIGLILKSLLINYRRPVTYPDTLLIAQKPHSLTPTQFTLKTAFYSLAQNIPVAYAESVCVWYDYENLKKAEGPVEMRDWVKVHEHTEE